MVLGWSILFKGTISSCEFLVSKVRVRNFSSWFFIELLWFWDICTLFTDFRTCMLLGVYEIRGLVLVPNIGLFWRAGKKSRASESFAFWWCGRWASSCSTPWCTLNGIDTPGESISFVNDVASLAPRRPAFSSFRQGEVPFMLLRIESLFSLATLTSSSYLLISSISLEGEWYIPPETSIIDFNIEWVN